MTDHVSVSGDETYALAAFVAAHRWLPPASYRADGLPAEVVSVSECLTDLHPHEREPTLAAPWHTSHDEAVGVTGCEQDEPVHTLAMSVPASDAADLLAVMRQRLGDHPHPILTNLVLGAAPPAGRILGFEVLGFDEGQFHSWLCYSLHRDAATSLGLSPGEVGLLGTLAGARLVADMANRDRDSDEGFAGDCMWFPALITQHGTSDFDA